jgi:Fur family peroxide stress response transcriptional regulator
MENDFKKLGLKLTPQRLAIMHLLEGNTSHPSAEDIHGALKPLFPTMSLATVYKTLEALKGKGLLQELTVQPGRKRFDPNPRPHPHLVCTRCSRVVDAELKEGPVLQDAKGFKLIRANVEFYGLCPRCST